MLADRHLCINAKKKIYVNLETFNSIYAAFYIDI